MQLPNYPGVDAERKFKDMNGIAASAVIARLILNHAARVRCASHQLASASKTSMPVMWPRGQRFDRRSGGLSCNPMPSFPHLILGQIPRRSAIGRKRRKISDTHTFDSGNVRLQGFCPQCGTALYATSAGNEPKAYNVRIGSLRQRNELVPRRQIFARSQQAWVNDLNSIPKFEAMPPH